MKNSKCLDSCIKSLRDMCCDPTNELEPKQRKAIAAEVRKLRKLKKQPILDREELKRAVHDIAVLICDVK